MQTTATHDIVVLARLSRPAATLTALFSFYLIRRRQLAPEPRQIQTHPELLQIAIICSLSPIGRAFPFEGLDTALKMPPIDPMFAEATPNSTVLREEGNSLYKAGKIPEGVYALSHN